MRPDAYIPNRFADKVLLVTGAAMGTDAQGVSDPGYRMSIGAATTIRAAREGTLVACADVKADGPAATMDLIAADGGTAVAIAADVTSSEDTDRAVGQVEAGRLDEPALGADVLEGQNELQPEKDDRDDGGSTSLDAQFSRQVEDKSQVERRIGVPVEVVGGDQSLK